MKYIIVKEHDGLESGVVFPEHLSHCDIAKVHRATGLCVVSAGFCSLASPVRSWGRSDSMNMESRDTDQKVLARDFTWE